MTNPIMRLDGKVAFVTGAASGLGKRIAEVFAQAGAAVAVVDMNAAAAQTVADAIVQQGGRALAIGLDVTDEAGVDAAVVRITKELGGLDVLVSNAGVQIVAPLQDFSFADWRKVMAVHLDAGFLTSRAAMRAMIASGKGGSIILMGSVHSKEASRLKAPYVAAKHGLEGLSKVIAKEGAPYNIRSNVVCPGFVRTPLVEKQISDIAAEKGISQREAAEELLSEKQPSLDFASPEQLGGTVAFLCSGAADQITGTAISVDGGWTAR